MKYFTHSIHQFLHLLRAAGFCLVLIPAGCQVQLDNSEPTQKGLNSKQSEPVVPPPATSEASTSKTDNLNINSNDPSPLYLIPAEVGIPKSWMQRTLDRSSWGIEISGTSTPGKEVGLSLKAKPKGWNLYEKLWLAVDVENHGQGEVLIRGGLKHPHGPVGAEVVPAGEKKTLAILIVRKLQPEHSYLRKDIPTVFGLPGGHFAFWRNLDATSVKKLHLHISSTSSHVNLELSKLRALVDFKPPSQEAIEENFFPYFDRFGQNAHKDWFGKVQSTEDLKAQVLTEAEELKQYPRPNSWNQYGGWSEGPQLDASGHFRTTKHNGAWWLVDPDGRLFWSFGINNVIGRDVDNTGRTSPPAMWEVLEQMPSDEPQARTLPGVWDKSWNPYMANLFRKYGEDWVPQFAEQAHQRLAAWGINTVGNWSGVEVTKTQKTPYVHAIHHGHPALSYGRTSFQASLPDVFHPDYIKGLHDAVAKKTARSANDPWCIGIFIDNEMPFKSPLQIGSDIFKASPKSPTKQAMGKWLKQKYSELNKLNTAWAKSYQSWQALVEDQEVPHNPKFKTDAEQFAEVYLNKYYASCRAALKEAAPNKLYLGSRIYQYFPMVFKVCAAYADVVSVNLYKFSPVELPLLNSFEEDKPILIGEFHFGTLNEQGVWGPGLTQAKDLDHSARLMTRYIQDGLNNPRIVGAHWFQYTDQPLSGRGDGENFRVGFVNITDTPHPALTQASRKLGEEMYKLRFSTAAPPRP